MMTRNVSTLAVVLTLLCAGTADAQWRTKYGDALRAARAAKRPVLVVMDNPTNPKASLPEVTETPDTTVKALLAGYELCHIDTTTEHGKKVAEAYKATDEPMTVILDNTTKKIMFKRKGLVKPLELVTALVKNRSGKVAGTRANLDAFKFDDCYS